MAPFVPPYVELRQAGFERTLEDARRFTVNWWGWLASPAALHRWLLHPDFRGVAFPGIVPVIGGLAGFAIALRSRHSSSESRTHALFYLLLGTFAFWLSFGPQAGLYTLLHQALPVFAFLRAVERFAVLVTLALCVGLGFAVAHLARRWPTGRRFRRSALVVLVLLAIADSWVAPVYYPPALPVPSVYRALARAPHGAVAEFPFFARRVNLNRHAHYMLFSTYHWKPLVNGYSDFYPADYVSMLPDLTMFPSAPRSFDHLRVRDTKYVIMHLHWYSEARRSQVRQGLAHYVAQGVLRRFGRDVARDAEGTVTYDVEAYEILRYP